ncbi:MoaD/ThiS family protein, partial [Paenibacillus sepulcri]|nr:MoaD/ThiS family protein [Paenibacillus sepulcri]
MSNQWNIQLFAGLAERLAEPAIRLQLDEDQMPVSALKQALIVRYPAHESLITASFMASNQSYAADDDIVKCTNELALLPPVSG